MILPLAAPGVFTTAIITFIAVWNDYMIALTFGTKPEMYTAIVAVSKFTGAYGFDTPWGTIMAAGVMITVPLLVAVSDLPAEDRGRPHRRWREVTHSLETSRGVRFTGRPCCVPGHGRRFASELGTSITPRPELPPSAEPPRSSDRPPSTSSPASCWNSFIAVMVGVELPRGCRGNVRAGQNWRKTLLSQGLSPVRRQGLEPRTR